MRCIFLVFFLVLWSIPLVASAQDVTGDVEGWLRDLQTGESVASAKVTVTGPNLLGSRTTTSMQDGFFRIPGIPVGTYTVAIIHGDYQGVQFDEVEVALGRTTSMGAVHLATRPEVEELIVSGRRVLLDFSSTEVGANLDEEDLEALPTPRDYREVISYLPQANASFLGDGTNVAGSSGSENQFFIEGVNVTETFLADGGMRLPQNFVREIQVKNGGYEAEYGKATGGIVNVITHSGSNEFSGAAFGFVTNNNFASDSRRGVADLQQDDFDRYDFGLSLGGPIARDKVWYFLAYNPTFETETLRIPSQESFEDRAVSHLFAGKLTWSIDSTSQLDLTVFGNPTRTDEVGQDVLIGSRETILNPDPFLSDQTKGAIAASLTGEKRFGSSALLEASVSRVEANRKKEPSTELGWIEPSLVDNFSNTLSGGMQNRFDHHTVRWSTAVSSTFFAGSHEIKAGAAYEDIFLDENWFIQTRDGRDGIVWRNDESQWLATALYNDFEVRHRAPSVFLQDSWRASHRLRVNAGLRWDGLYIIDADGEVGHSLEDQFQPRAGLTYSVNEEGTRKVSGSYGRFYEQIPMIAASWYFGRFFQSLDFYDEDPLPDFLADPYFSLVFDGSNLAIDEDLKGQYMDEFTIGYEEMIGTSWKIGVRGMHRKVGRVIEDSIVDPETGLSILGNPGEGLLDYLPDPKHDYSALEFVIGKTRGDRVRLSSSYVLSRTSGNYPGAFDTDGDNPHAHVSSSYWGPAQISEGLLPNDRTHVFKLYGSYRFDYGAALGAFFTWQSGTPLSEYGGTVVGPNAFSHLVPRGTAGRTPSIWDLNLRFSFDLAELTQSLQRARPRLLVDVFHLFGQRKPVDIDQVRYLILDQDGNQAGPNPNFGEVMAYQPPMTVRIGIESAF